MTTRNNGLIGLAVAAAMMAVTAPVQAVAEAAPSPDANLYIYRAYAEPTLWAVRFEINGVMVAKIRNSHYTALHVPPGTYRVKLVWTSNLSGQPDSEGEFTVHEGTTQYIELSAGLPAKFVTPTGVRTGYAQPTLAEVTAEFGARRVPFCCKYEAPKVAEFVPTGGGE